MLFNVIFATMSLVATVVAMPAAAPAPTHLELVTRVQQKTPGGKPKFLGAAFGGKSKGQVANAVASKKAAAAQKAAAAKSAAAGKGAAASSSAAAAAASASASAVRDSGIANVIDACTNPDGETGCSEILGDVAGSCFTIPDPLANHVEFFLPPPQANCTLFSDEDCTQGPTPALGVIKNAAQNSWSCESTAAAA